MAVLLLLGILIRGAVASSCPEGERTPVDGRCGSYLECTNGSPALRTCPLLHLFDRQSLACRWSPEVDCQDKAVECDEGQSYPDPGSCRGFQICRAGRLDLQSCPLLHVFDSSQQKCKIGLDCDKPSCVGKVSRAVPGDCSAYEECSSGSWRRRKCAPMFKFDGTTQRCRLGDCKQCRHGETERTADCSEFRRCEYGVWTVNSCGLVRRYDPGSQKCVWWFQYNCQGPSAVSFQSVQPEAPRPTSRKARRSRSSCTEGERKKIYNECSSYLECVRGEWVKKDCQDFTVFQPETSSCVDYSKYHCETTTTSSPSSSSTTSTTTDSTPPPGSCTKGTRRGIENDCKEYYECEADGTWQKKMCPKFLGFIPRGFDVFKLDCELFANCS